MAYQNFTVIGRIASDPIAFQGKNGQRDVRFSLSFTHHFKKKDSNEPPNPENEYTMHVTAIIPMSNGKAILDHGVTGAKLFCAGPLVIRPYVNHADGVERMSVLMYVQKWEWYEPPTEE